MRHGLHILLSVPCSRAQGLCFTNEMGNRGILLSPVMEEPGMDPKQCDFNFSAENHTRGSRTQSPHNVGIKLILNLLVKQNIKLKSI